MTRGKAKNRAVKGAEKMLHMAEKTDFTMYDAGMLGLGYYRIIELEINQRIIFPMIKDFWIEAMTGKKNSMDDEAWKTFEKAGNSTTTSSKLSRRVIIPENRSCWEKYTSSSY